MNLLEGRSPWFRLLLRCALLGAVLASGITVGAFLERFGLRGSSPSPAAPPSARVQLLGRWINERDETWTEFRPDGTFDTLRVTSNLPASAALAGALARELKDFPPPPTRETVSGQYRWLDDDHIEVTLPKSEGGGKVAFRVIIRDDDLTMIHEDGEVGRGKRQR